MINGMFDLSEQERARVFFTLEEGVSARLRVSGGNEDSVPVTLLSVGSDEIGFLAVQFKVSNIQIGDRLILTDIRMPQPMGTIERVDVTVKYVINLNRRIRCSLGCEFIEVPRPFHFKYMNLLYERLNRCGLYSHG